MESAAVAAIASITTCLYRRARHRRYGRGYLAARRGHASRAGHLAVGRLIAGLIVRPARLPRSFASRSAIGIAMRSLRAIGAHLA